MWFAAIVVCQLAVGQCGVRGIRKPDSTPMTTEEECNDLFAKAMWSIANKEEMRAQLIDGTIVLTGGCIASPDGTKPDAREFFRRFAPKEFKGKKKEEAI